MSKWQPLRETEYAYRDEKEQALAEATGVAGERILLNNKYQVSIRDRGDFPPFGYVLEMSLKRRDKQPIFDWRDIQRIKTELFGAETEMVQLFPAESRHVDTANQYYFFVFAGGYRFPFGFRERALSEHNQFTSNSKQRPFEVEHRELNPDIGAQDEYLADARRKILTRAAMKKPL